MDSVIIVTALATLAAYVWSLKRHFVAGDMSGGARVVSAGVVLTAILYLFLTLWGDQPVWAQAIGLALQLAAGALFFWAITASREARLDFAFTPEKPRGLVETGPYRHIRHPFYTSYIIFWTGWALATWSAYALLALIILIALYVVAARAEEEKFSQSPLAPAYAAYKRRAGFFWPRLIGRKKSGAA